MIHGCPEVQFDINKEFPRLKKLYADRLKEAGIDSEEDERLQMLAVAIWHALDTDKDKTIL